MDTVFSLFVTCLLIVFITINLYADSADRFSILEKQRLKALERGSRNCLKPISV